MLKKVIKNGLWLSLGLLIITSQAMAVLPSFQFKPLQFEPHLEGQPKLKNVQMKFTNNTPYKLWFSATAVDMFDTGIRTFIDPIGSVWVEPGESLEEENRFKISYGIGIIGFSVPDSFERRIPDDWAGVESPDGYNISIKLEEGIQEVESKKFGFFIVDIKASPVPIFIRGTKDIETLGSDKEWTCIMHDFDIIVSVKEKEEL